MREVQKPPVVSELDILSLSDLVRSFNLQNVAAGYTFLDKLETTAEKQETPVYRYDSLEFARLFAAKKLDPIPMLTRRANSKALSEKLSFALIGVPSTLNNAYKRTFLCANFVVSEDGRYKSKYCHNRWCLTCGRIKTAKYINEYTPVIKTFDAPYLVTLTQRNVGKNQLKHLLQQMGHDWRKITDLARKQNRGLQGIRKLECTYNGTTNTYHPHFHIVVNGENNANFIIDRWIELDAANREPVAQDSRPADENSLKELFKYFTKLTTNSSKDPNITIPAINHIFETIKGKRVFQSFGFVKPKPFVPDVNSPEFDQTMLEVSELRKAFQQFNDALPYEKPTPYFWDTKISNWVNSEDADTLTPYTPTKNVLTFEQKFIYETGNGIAQHRTNDASDTNTNSGLDRFCPGMARGGARTNKNLANAENVYHLQKRPPGG